MEAADRNAQKLKGTHELDLRVSEISQGTKKNCYRCGSEQHGPRECPYREVECRSCKKKGHLARMCQSRSRIGHKNSGQTNAIANPSKKWRGTTRRDANWVNTTEEGQAETEPFLIQLF